MKNAKNLHVPMPADLHGELRQVAARLGKTSTAVAREAIEDYLRRIQKQATDQAIQDWARETAGTEYDLDADLEDATVEFLLDDGRCA
jgi:predicted transcriptional regulator